MGELEGGIEERVGGQFLKGGDSYFAFVAWGRTQEKKSLHKGEEGAAS